MLIGSRIKAIREKHNLTMKQFADLFNLSESVISLYESGKRYPSHDIILKISKNFSISLDFIYGNDKYIDNSSIDSKEKELIEKTKDLSPEGLKELDELIDLLKYKDMMKKEKEYIEKNKSL